MSCKLTLLLAIFASTVSAAITYDAEFWAGFEDETPYEHKWTDIPDMINNNTVYWWFNQTQHFLTGVERGLYTNDSIVLHEDCFGVRFVERVNWLAAMMHHGVWHNWSQELAVIY
jgi:hypothetical protein